MSLPVLPHEIGRRAVPFASHFADSGSDLANPESLLTLLSPDFKITVTK